LYCTFEPGADPLLAAVDLTGGEQEALEEIKRAFESQKTELKLKIKQIAEKLADEERKVADAKDELSEARDEAQAANKKVRERDINLYKKERDIMRLSRKVNEYSRHEHAVEHAENADIDTLESRVHGNKDEMIAVQKKALDFRISEYKKMSLTYTHSKRELAALETKVDSLKRSAKEAKAREKDAKEGMKREKRKREQNERQYQQEKIEREERLLRQQSVRGLQHRQSKPKQHQSGSSSSSSSSSSSQRSSAGPIGIVCGGEDDFDAFDDPTGPGGEHGGGAEPAESVSATSSSVFVPLDSGTAETSQSAAAGTNPPKKSTKAGGFNPRSGLSGGADGSVMRRPLGGMSFSRTKGAQAQGGDNSGSGQYIKRGFDGEHLNNYQSNRLLWCVDRCLAFCDFLCRSWRVPHRLHAQENRSCFSEPEGC
jgi:hypothetical protein